MTGYVVVYLTAIIVANLTVTVFGPSWSIVNAFLLVGLDLTTRDVLHDRWRHRGLWWRMGLLITTGSVVSWLLNPAAGRVAVASAVAFGAASVTDTTTYHLLRDREWTVRVNGSNIPAAFVDSVVFPTIAFGGFLPWITVGQFTAKVVGGWLWSLLLERRRVTARR